MKEPSREKGKKPEEVDLRRSLAAWCARQGTDEQVILRRGAMLYWWLTGGFASAKGSDER
jgi:hypothetical protein